MNGRSKACIENPVGLSFSVERDVRPLPRSLQNIYTELQSDLGIAPCEHGDLTGWFEQGVLLLNRCLTVQPGRPASHRGKGWEEVTVVIRFWIICGLFVAAGMGIFYGEWVAGQ